MSNTPKADMTSSDIRTKKQRERPTLSPIGLVQILKRGAKKGNTRASINIGTLYIPLKPQDADSIELLEAILNDPELKESTVGEMVELLQEGIFQLQIRVKTGTIIHPKLSPTHKKASFHVDRLIAEKHSEAEVMEIFQDVILWFAIIGILKFTDEEQAKKEAKKQQS